MTRERKRRWRGRKPNSWSPKISSKAPIFASISPKSQTLAHPQACQPPKVRTPAIFRFLAFKHSFSSEKWWCDNFLATMLRLSKVDQNYAAAYFFSVTQVQFGPRHRSSTWNHAVARFCFCWKLISSQANELLQCVLTSFHSSWLLTWPGFNFLNTFALQNT